ncbi:GntR family transcriptional regulator [Marinobacter salinexigens]|uniref:GntR family transcriptional regulator n=1 Tax=Marinobacter salinexigens TaxID=2919747 RepID=A0A5B0VPB3_9GAMM|nr:GntR family transcriptional regulator [Marinobacter salinexigens]KAA1176035.1 GntR family transcriptional regulator [Marinobacter salinexigens]
MATGTTRKASMADTVYEALREDIFELRLTPGDKFSEGDVGQRLNASRTPVREALYRLQREGYVEVLFRSGWQVKPLSARQVDDLYELRITLEQAAIHKLCSPTSPAPSLPMLNSQATPVTSISPLEERNFHCDLVAAAGNQEMSRVHSEIMDRLRLISRHHPADAAHAGDDRTEHAMILEAVKAGNETEAERRLISHIRIGQQAARKYTGNQEDSTATNLNGEQKSAPNDA